MNINQETYPQDQKTWYVYNQMVKWHNQHKYYSWNRLLNRQIQGNIVEHSGTTPSFVRFLNLGIRLLILQADGFQTSKMMT